jgi:hypothetical protein
VKVTAHAFVAGTEGHLVLYCQAPAEAGTEPVPGYPGKTCGHLEGVHTMTSEQEATSDDALAESLIRKIGGWPR